MGNCRGYLKIPVLALAIAVGACAAPQEALRPVKRVDPDSAPVAMPSVHGEYRNWDFIDHNLVYPVGSLLDIGLTARRIGGVVGIGGGRQADNVNALDEACNSSWYTNRHFQNPMTLEALATGPGVALPDTSGPWEIVSGKFFGVSAGFNVRDPSGRVFILKFDTKDWPEMASSAEVISTKILHAAGYNVPTNSVAVFHPSRLFIGPKARVRNADGSRRPMTPADLDSVWAKVSVDGEGRVRAMSSQFLPGVPIGPFRFHHVRRDDPNDRVAHQHRRELRGLRVISSWLNDADRRTANTLDMFQVTGPDSSGYVRHYLIDMGSTLGSNSRIPHLPRYGNEYLWDPVNILEATLSLGFYSPPWAMPDSLAHPSIGNFDNSTFRPGGWVTAYPNPAFQACTSRDGYWGAKMVMAFTDEEIATIVRTGKLSSPAAERELTRLLIERRDAIGRYWFARVAPLDRFRVEGGSLRFDDLSITGGLVGREGRAYHVRISDEGGRWRHPPTKTGSAGVPLPGPGTFRVEIRVEQTPGGTKSPRVCVWIASEGETGTVFRVERED